MRLLHTSYLVFAMTDHFFGCEGGEKEAGYNYDYIKKLMTRLLLSTLT